MGNICIIGPRASGKTTYLAALSYLPELQISRGKKSTFKVIPLGEEGRSLSENAENILVNGLMFEPTGYVLQSAVSVDDLPFYSFKLEVKNNFFQKKSEIYLNVRDYPGEIFQAIIEPNLDKPIFQECIDECLAKDINGCLILFTALEKGADKFYRSVMGRFIELMDVNERTNNLRLAIAISKCERGEIWPGRIDPETDLFGVHLPRTHAFLRDRLSPKNLRFYAISAFGVQGKNNPRPNRKMISENKEGSILLKQEKWQPYNLIEPLYWLSQG